MDTQKDYGGWRALPWRTNSSINWTLLRFSSPVAPFHKLLALSRSTDAGCMLCLMTLSSAVWIHREAFSLSACKPLNYLKRSSASHYVHNYACQWFWFDSADTRGPREATVHRFNVKAHVRLQARRMNGSEGPWFQMLWFSFAIPGEQPHRVQLKAYHIHPLSEERSCFKRRGSIVAMTVQTNNSVMDFEDCVCMLGSTQKNPVLSMHIMQKPVIFKDGFYVFFFPPNYKKVWNRCELLRAVFLHPWVFIKVSPKLFKVGKKWKYFSLPL